MDSDLSFTRQILKLDKQFDQVLLKSVWEQVSKDFSLAGLSGLPQNVPSDPEKFVSTLSEFIKQAQNRFTNWDNLNYRIDLPPNVNYDQYSYENYAQAIAFRCLQKVWLRREFNSRRIER